MATKKAKNTVIKNADKVKVQVKNIHDTALHATDTIVDNSLAIGKEWQSLFAKAVKKGTHLFGKQQDIVLDTLEGIKDYTMEGGEKMLKLLEIKTPIRPLKTPLLSKIAAQKASATKKAKAVLAKSTKVAKATKAKSGSKKAAKKASSKSDVKQNDLKIIEGIGPKIEGLFYKAGIKTFEQLANADLKTLKDILATAGPRYKSHNPTTWRKQAKLAAAGKVEALKKLQDELKGGRRVKK